MQYLFKFCRDESGASVIEYSLLLALITLAIVNGVDLLGGEVGNTMNIASNALSSSR